MTNLTPEQIRALADDLHTIDGRVHSLTLDRARTALRAAADGIEFQTKQIKFAIAQYCAAADQLETVEANVIGRALYGRAWDEAHENGSPWAHISDEQSATVARVLDAILTAKTAPQANCHERPGGYCDVHGFRHDTAPQEDRDE